MLTFKLSIINPWSRGNWKNYVSWTRVLWGTRVAEIQLHANTRELFSLALDTAWRGRDHAGPELEITVLCQTVTIRLYDSRHWDYINNKWEKHTGVNT